MANNQKTDLDMIPYTAPLSIEEPPRSFILRQNLKGLNRTRLTLPNADLSGKWVLISGANNGIGREASLQMAKWGASIILACREPPRTEAHPSQVVQECRDAARRAGYEKSQFEWWEVDCAKLDSVEALATRWLETGRPLDILCNNAGMGSNPGRQHVVQTQDGFEIIHQVNFLSHVLLTLRLLPALAKASTPRVICTTSCFHFLGQFDLGNVNGEIKCVAEGVGFYQNNKLWFQVWLTELQRRLLQHDQYKHITVNGVHPGYVNSGIWNMNGSGWIALFMTVVFKLVAYLLGINSQQGSLAILNAATSLDAGPDPAVQGVGKAGGRGGGRYFSRVWEETPMPHTKDPDCRQRVWRKVNDELKLQEKGLLDVLGLKYIE